MKQIGILTIFKASNYGAVLQAYALLKTIENLGYAPKIINYEPKGFGGKNKHGHFLGFIKHFIKYYILGYERTKNHKFKIFRSHYLPISKEYDTFFYNIDQEFRLIVVGSDQVWNPEYTNGIIDEGFILQHINNSVTKISYASSAGSYIFEGKNANILKKSLLKFKAIAVREQSLAIQFTNMGIQNVKTVLDPTLLVPQTTWDEIAKDSADICPPNEYLLIYTFDNNSDCFKVSRAIAQKLHLKIVSINFKFCGGKTADYNISNASPSDFLALFSHASFIVTNSFHGTCFSLIYKKNFFSIKKKNNPQRVANLLSSIGLEGRILDGMDDLKDVPSFSIDYYNVDSRMRNLQNHSLSYLKENLSDTIL